MYIKKVEIANVRSIYQFEMTFDSPSGWHVLIGDNGAGKSTILRAIALGLIGPEQIIGLGRKSEWVNWSNWLRHGEKHGMIQLTVENAEYFDHVKKSGHVMEARSGPITGIFSNTFGIDFHSKDGGGDYVEISTYPHSINSPSHPIRWNWNTSLGWFSASFGANRKFASADESEVENAQSRYAQLLAHLTLFDDLSNLAAGITWLKQKRFEQLDKKNNHLDKIVALINTTKLLPYGTVLSNVSSDGVVFTDGNGMVISITDLSDGFKSMLGLFFELLRQIFFRYDQGLIFSSNGEDGLYVGVPGIVLIDEIDAHLHPTWQTTIGHWFTKYFPNIQFIVTTHSPLICRACEKGSIWRLAAPGSDIPSGEIKGTDRQRLIYGNVLDAYGTELFGEDVSQSSNAEEMLKELADLNLKSFKGRITERDKKRMQELKKILPTES